jgi:hypothetical protein
MDEKAPTQEESGVSDAPNTGADETVSEDVEPNEESGGVVKEGE